ncbi:hypothetical protein SAMN05421767_14610 [Granulicatella balaenopterae]|uniref:Uncharacterized protein n=1 Tax=Granulicatella balaenopterae TaxID=137733 RepID=A0A1H9NUJ8_9LACT|nr:hypothetical protein [Granulicatella balaenopterae]SER39640.1 hypothetical protein SAMN05421767_14610 [Granulicatella balaenopterae]
MKQTRNLKQKMLMRAKKEDLQKTTCILTLLMMVVSMMNPLALIYASSVQNTNSIIENKVEYTTDHSKANITFDMNSFDKEKYELVSILSDKEGTVLYDQQKNEIASYATEKNGSYGFTVKYAEKQPKAINKSEQTNEAQSDNEEKDSQHRTAKEEKITVKVTKIKESTDSEKSKNDATAESTDLNKQNNDAAQDSIESEKQKNDVVEESTDSEKSKNEAAQESAKSEKAKNDKIETSSAVEFMGDLPNKFGEGSVVYNTPNNENLLSFGNSHVNLEEQFTYSGTISETNNSGYPVNPKRITNDYFKINKNRISLGKGNTSYSNQTIYLQSKYKIDFTRNFEIKGSLKYTQADKLSGFTVAFHNDKKYVSKNVNATLGVYSSKGIWASSTWAGEVGLNRGIVLEFDPYKHQGNNSYQFGDNLSTGQHIQILETNDVGAVETPSIQNKDIDLSNYNNSWTNFKISWNAHTNTLELYFNDQLMVKKNSFNNLSILKKNKAYISFSASTNTAIQDLLEFNFNDIKYTDIDPEISTNYTVQSGKKDAISNEKVTITHEIWNGNKSTAEITDKLNLKAMKIDGKEKHLEILNVKTGTDLNNLNPISTGKKFDVNHPLDVICPPNSNKYYVQYEVTIPKLEKYGELSNFNLEVLLGQRGMSQILSSTVIKIKNKPALYAKAKQGNAPITNSQIIKVNNPTKVNKELLWNELYAKIASPTSKKYKIRTEDKGTQEMKFEWEYQVNGEKVNEFPKKIEKGCIYTLKLKVIDQSDNRLTNEFNRTVIVDDNTATITNHYIYAKDSKPISETKLVTLTKEEFENYVKTASKAKAFKVNQQTGLVELEDVKVQLNGWLDSNGEPYHLPGKATIELYVEDDPNVKKSINQEVTENTWSYDTSDRTEINGASGFIVIPKSVTLESGTKNQKDKLVGQADIYFADYTAEDVEYDVSVDKTFELVKVDDPSSKFTVTSVGNKLSAQNKMEVGKINSQYKDKPQIIHFEAPRHEVDKSKGNWKGNVRFYFKRI